MASNGDPEVESGYVTLSVGDGASMPAYTARPAGNSHHSGLIVLQEAFGVNAHIRDITMRFARRGYVAIAPALFHRTDANFEGSYSDFAGAGPHMQAMTDDGQAADMRAAYEWLMARDGGRTRAVGSIGYCMGGRASFLANATLPLKAAVSYYGGGIAPSGRPGQSHLLGHASDLHAPMLFFWGGQDAHILPEHRRSVSQALDAAGREYVTATFSAAGHGFFCDVRPAYEPHAARQSLALTLSFLETYLPR